MKHVLSILVKNKAGVMSHVSGLFTRRGFNIDSIAVGETHDPQVSIITIILQGDQQTVVQIERQLLKLPDVIKVKCLPYHGSLIRENLLVRINIPENKRTEMFGIVEVFGGRVAEITETSLMIELSGNNRQISSFIKMIEPYGIIEMARTGQIALAFENAEA